MTNEEAIKEIQKWLDGCPFADTKEAFNLAIKALETGEVYMTGVDYNLYIEGYKDGKRDFEPKQGVWVHHRNDYGHNIADCSLCGKAMQWHDEDEDGIPKYCWYCGADMRKGGAEND